jgi:hypothetical protein
VIASALSGSGARSGCCRCRRGNACQALPVESAARAPYSLVAQYRWLAIGDDTGGGTRTRMGLALRCLSLALAHTAHHGGTSEYMKRPRFPQRFAGRLSFQGSWRYMAGDGVTWGVSASDVGTNVGRVAEGETAYRPGPGSDVDRRLDPAIGLGRRPRTGRRPDHH